MRIKAAKRSPARRKMETASVAKDEAMYRKSSGMVDKYKEDSGKE